MLTIHRSIEVVAPTDPNGTARIAATVWLPENLPPTPTVVFAFPGGGYSRGYYDLHPVGLDGYSQADHHAAHGVIMVGVDHLGVGDSSVSANAIVTIEDIAAANDAAVREILSLLRSGGLAADVPAIIPGAVVGMGQSMGGGVCIIMQGRSRTFDAVAVLGYSAIHTVLPMRRSEDGDEVKNGVFGSLSRTTAPSALSVSKTSHRVPDFVYPFHWENVPADVLAADLAGGYPVRTDPPAWGSATIPNCVVAMMGPGYVKEEAAILDVPVFLGFGERDTSENPLHEPSAFPHSPDITLYTVAQTAHMHNFGTGRQALWDRLVGWFAGLPVVEEAAAALH